MTPSAHSSKEATQPGASDAVAGRPAHHEALARQLQTLLMRGDMAALDDVLGVADPFVAELLLADDAATDALLRLPARDVRRWPHVAALRLVAWGGGHVNEEVAVELREAALGLLGDGDAHWGAFAATWSLRWLLYLGEWNAAVAWGLDVADAHPELGEVSPLFTTTLASAASMAGTREVARRLWDEALHHPVADASADLYWHVRIGWACTELIPCRGDLAQALVLLRRARNHFATASGSDAVEQLHRACMNTGVSMILAGHSAAAIVELDSDELRFPKESLHSRLLCAFRAWAHADRGEVDKAERLLADCLEIPANNPGLLQCAIGPTRLKVAAGHGAREQIAGIVADLLRSERSTPPLPELQVHWRTEAALACAGVGLHREAMQHADEALDVATTKLVPHFAARAFLVRMSLQRDIDTAWDDAAAALELGEQHELYELFTEREPARGGQALLAAVHRSRGDDRFVRHAMLLLGPSIMQATVERSGVLASTSLVSSVVQQRLQELGVQAPAPGGQAAIPQREGARIEVLGALRVSVGGQELPQAVWRGRRKAMLLLARLLLERGTPLHRDEIAEDLWPGLAPSKVSGQLAPLVHTLRRALETDLERGSPGRYVRTRAGAYQLNLRPDDSCDLFEFLDAARVCITTDASEQALQAGLQALSAYGGEFLAGLGFDDWINQARAHLQGVVNEVTLVVADEELTQQQRLQHSLLRLNELLTCEPTNERAASLLMRHHALQGDLATSSTIFHKVRAALAEEVGLSPSSELRQLHAALIGPGD